VIARVTSAFLRAFLVALLLVTPALLAPNASADSAQVVMLLALLGSGFVFMEYASAYPSVIEFRYAPPFNRLRFGFLFMAVIGTAFIARGSEGDLARLFTALGGISAQALDFPFSPVRLMTLAVPAEATDAFYQNVRLASGLAYVLSLIMVAVFLVLVRVLGWPASNGAFNVWLNLPLFDPTAGGDVVTRLVRDARINYSLGFLLPFLIPAIAKSAAGMIDLAALQDPQTMIWTIAIWAFFPAMLITRGLAMSRIAEMIETKRRRAYARADADANSTTMAAPITSL
jgi:hypothetical protein